MVQDFEQSLAAAASLSSINEFLGQHADQTSVVHWLNALHKCRCLVFTDKTGPGKDDAASASLSANGQPISKSASCPRAAQPGHRALHGMYAGVPPSLVNKVLAKAMPHLPASAPVVKSPANLQTALMQSKLAHDTLQDMYAGVKPSLINKGFSKLAPHLPASAQVATAPANPQIISLSSWLSV